MSTELFRKYIDIINEAETSLLDINSIASRYKFLPTTKQNLTYKPHGQEVTAQNVNQMKPFTYAIASEPFTLETVTSDGLETTQPIEQGYVIICGPSGEKYYNKLDKFKKNYPVDKGNGAVGPSITDKRMVAQHTGKESGIMPVSYGGTSALKPGDFLVYDATGSNPDSKYYRIAKFEYENTYNPPGK